MLESIHIKNFAIINALQLEFDAGLTALTGETGAGKSIILDAIKLVAGDRADSDNIKSGEDRAEICVCFNIDRQQDARDWLDENELASNDECIIRRVLYRNGRSKAFINGYNAPLSQLKELLQMLVDIHGQHDHQSLQKSTVQLQLLDACLSDQLTSEEVSRKYAAWRRLKTQYDNVTGGSQAREQRIDLLKLYCRELDDLNLEQGEFEQMQSDYKRLSNAGQLLQNSAQVLGLLYDNEESTAQSLLNHCRQVLVEQLENDTRLSTSHELVNNALIQVQEASNELRIYQDSIDLDETQLDALNQRIANAQNLARKHHVNIDDLPELTAKLHTELDSLQSSEFDMESVGRALAKATSDYLGAAHQLTIKRQQAAENLSDQITAEMQQLGMQGGIFSIEIKSRDDESGFRSQGVDQVTYQVSTNPGQPPKPLNKVASGGELSRISLAIQVILSASSSITTLIFDEVDSGVGGGIAEIVGSKLRELGINRQVLCVTHLAQVASQAHQHYRVEKRKTDRETATEVLPLGERQRLEEVARMLGGIIITEQTRAHANEMINNARNA